MEKIEQEKQPEKYGENIEMVIDLVRHAEKNPQTGEITEAGEKDSKEFGQRLREEFPQSAGIKAYHSPIQRAKKTAESIMFGEKSFKTKEGEILAGKFSPDFFKKIEAKINLDNNEDKLIQAIIDTGQEKPDAGTKSSKEMSQDMAGQILKLIEMTKRFKNDSKVNVVLVSHSGIIENFLVDLLKKEREGFVEEIGGQMKFLESLRFFVERQDKENASIKINFRDHQLEIALKDLESLS